MMSGTSMDGIDISLTRTNGKTLSNLNNYFYEYNKTEKEYLERLLANKKNILENEDKLIKANSYVSKLHIKALSKLNDLKIADIIGFHGQTIHHDPLRELTVQLGDPYLIANKFKKNVVFSFRSNDIKNGGQGAPIAPIYHKYLIKKFNLRLPCCIVNIGGISNLTYWDGDDLIAFDTGPGNCLLDDYMRKFKNKNYDKDGIISSNGKVDKMIVKNFLNEPFFKINPPKSLDRKTFENFYVDILKKNLSLNDAMATLLELTFETIRHSLKFVPKNINSIFLCGGGSQNKFLAFKFKKFFKSRYVNNKHFKINTQFIESEMIAYLSARCIYNLPITFPKTTGVQYKTTGGIVVKFL